MSECDFCGHEEGYHRISKLLNVCEYPNYKCKCKKYMEN